ncbi:MAG: hypothetical protein ACRDKJ_10420 [Actinomycetota bacterium]
MRTYLLAASAAVVLAAACTSTGRTIERLIVVNHTVYDVEVLVTSADRDGWRLLGRVAAGERAVDEEVEDLGDLWIFRFEHGGEAVGEDLRVERAELEGDEWTLEVPTEVEDRLRARDVDPSPRQR